MGLRAAEEIPISSGKTYSSRTFKVLIPDPDGIPGDAVTGILPVAGIPPNITWAEIFCISFISW